MKKFIFCFLALFAGLSCSKENRLCGCSPIEHSFFLTVKNQQNADLLDPSISGSYNHAAIKISYKKNNEVFDANATVSPPFQVSSTIKTTYFIRSNMVNLNLSKNVKEFFIDFGNGDKDTITFDAFSTVSSEPVNLKVNNNLLTKDPTAPQGSPFYILVK